MLYWTMQIFHRRLYSSSCRRHHLLNCVRWHAPVLHCGCQHGSDSHTEHTGSRHSTVCADDGTGAERHTTIIWAGAGELFYSSMNKMAVAAILGTLCMLFSWMKIYRLKKYIYHSNVYISFTGLVESYFDGLTQDCSNSSALAMELLQSCTNPKILNLYQHRHYHFLSLAHNFPPTHQCNLVI